MGEMSVMNREGDITIQWDPTDGESTANAKKEWDSLKACGFEFYEPAAPGATAKRVKNWNPDRALVTAAPGVQKPAARTGSRGSSKAMAGGPCAAVRADELTFRGPSPAPGSSFIGFRAER